MRLDFVRWNRVWQTRDVSLLKCFKNMLTNEIVAKMMLNGKKSLESIFKIANLNLRCEWVGTKNFVSKILFKICFYVLLVISPMPNKMLLLLKLGHCLQLLTRHCLTHRCIPPSRFLSVIPHFLIKIFKCFDERSKLLNLNKG